jgi:hypothetical protein
MNQTYFSSKHNLEEVISNQLKQAKTSIKVAVAWFTNPALLNCLLEKQKAGVSVEVIVTDDKINFTHVNFQKLIDAGGAVYVYKHTLMHHKFCVIDGCYTLNGSCNWTKKGTNPDVEDGNLENIQVSGEKESANQFNEQFESTKKYATLTRNVWDENFPTASGMSASEIAALVSEIENSPAVQNSKYAWVAVKFAKGIKQLLKHGISFAPFTVSDYADPVAERAWWNSQPGLALALHDAKNANIPKKENVGGVTAAKNTEVSGLLKDCKYEQVSAEQAGMDAFFTATSDGVVNVFKGIAPDKKNTVLAWAVYHEDGVEPSEATWLAYKFLSATTDEAATAWCVRVEMSQDDLNAAKTAVAEHLEKTRKAKK